MGAKSNITTIKPREFDKHQSDLKIKFREQEKNKKLRDPSIPKVSSIQRSISPDLSQLQFKKQQELLRERFKEEQTVRKTAQESTNENDTIRVKNNEFKKQQETLKEKFQKQQQQKSRESSKERRKNQVVADM